MSAVVNVESRILMNPYKSRIPHPNKSRILPTPHPTKSRIPLLIPPLYQSRLPTNPAFHQVAPPY